MLIFRSEPRHLQEQLRDPTVESLSHPAALALPRPEESVKLLHRHMISSLLLTCKRVATSSGLHVWTARSRMLRPNLSPLLGLAPSSRRQQTTSCWPWRIACPSGVTVSPSPPSGQAPRPTSSSIRPQCSARAARLRGLLPSPSKRSGSAPRSKRSSAMDQWRPSTAL